MALVRKVTTSPTGTQVEEWDVDNVALFGLGFTLGATYGLFRWIRSKIGGESR